MMTGYPTSSLGPTTRIIGTQLTASRGLPTSLWPTLHLVIAVSVVQLLPLPRPVRQQTGSSVLRRNGFHTSARYDYGKHNVAGCSASRLCVRSITHYQFSVTCLQPLQPEKCGKFRLAHVRTGGGGTTRHKKMAEASRTIHPHLHNRRLSWVRSVHK